MWPWGFSARRVAMIEVLIAIELALIVWLSLQ